MISAYPLTWPEGWKRQPAAHRTRARFSKSGYSSANGGQTAYRIKGDLSVMDATNRVLGELRRLGVVDRDDILISTNVKLRIDGLPRSDGPAPADPGVAVYWTDTATSAQRCMAIDLYDRVADNLAAVAATIEAMRAIERHGGAEILNRAFTGFTALPAPGDATRHWRQVLGFHDGTMPLIDQVESNYRYLRSRHHPDKGGSVEEFSAVQRAYDEACKELRG